MKSPLNGTKIALAADKAVSILTKAMILNHSKDSLNNINKKHIQTKEDEFKFKL